MVPAESLSYRNRVPRRCFVSVEFTLGGFRIGHLHCSCSTTARKWARTSSSQEVRVAHINRNGFAHRLARLVGQLAAFRGNLKSEAAK